MYRSTGKGTTVHGMLPVKLASLELCAYSLRSSFAIQVGKTAQNVRVFPSTASTTTWVVENVGCPSDAPSNCEDSRGGIFNKNTSLTWVPNSIFEIGIEENLGFDVFGDFGFDTVTLGWLGSGGPTVEHSIVAGIGDTTLTWLGVLGLNPRPTNFSTFVNNPQVSFIQALRNQNAIPSVSWSYTAGASYRMYHLLAKTSSYTKFDVRIQQGLWQPCHWRL